MLRPMIRRDWILDVLAELELWYWPIFFWNLAWLKNHIAARMAEGGAGLIGYGVTRRGHIFLKLDVKADRPDPNDWTRYVVRAPWQRLDPEARRTALAARCGEPLVIALFFAALPAVSGGAQTPPSGLPPILAPP